MHYMLKINLLKPIDSIIGFKSL